ncbi:hypothetical protein SOVF_026630 [Spinacia oleracea]|nr:hypothetical protein SOVF_026630 [Spinacia oleracea]
MADDDDIGEISLLFGFLSIVEFSSSGVALGLGISLLDETSSSSAEFSFLGIILLVFGVALAILFCFSCYLADKNRKAAVNKSLCCSVPLMIVLFALGIFALADEDILSDDDEDDVLDQDKEDEDSVDKEGDDGRHARMLTDITGIHTQAFAGKKRKGNVVTEAYPESEFNPSSDVMSSVVLGRSVFKTFRILFEELLVTASLGKGLNMLRRKVKQFKLRFPNRTGRGNDMGLPTVGTMASEFKPRSDFEKAIASIMDNKEVAEAYQSDGAKLLELNKISVEEVKDRQDRLAKMRSLLFRHEMKAKQIRTDPEAAREYAEKQERKRAEARMTLRHKNQGKWAKRVLERGLSKQDEGTQAAIAEQLHLHNLLTRKMNSVKENSSSDDSSCEDDEDMDSSDEEGASKLLAKAKEKTIKLMEQEDEVPDSGVLSLPFMVRGLEKRKEAGNGEAKRVLGDYELSLNQTAEKGLKNGTPSGRRVFGVTKKVEEANIKHRPDVDNYGSDNEDTIEEKDDIQMECAIGNHMEKDVEIDLDVLREDLETGDDSAFKSIIDVAEDSGPRTSRDVSVFTSGSWKQMKNDGSKGGSTYDANVKSKPEVAKPSPSSESGEEEVVGI